MSSINQAVTEEYFNNLSAEYTRLIVESQRQIYRNINPVLTRRVSGRTLSLGSGPVMNFADTKTDHVVCADISFNMLTQLPVRPKISRVNADAQALPFDVATFDVIVIPFLIHHMAQDDTQQTDAAIARMFAECARVLRKSGRILIADLFIPPWIEAFERFLYHPACYLLNKRERPMMFFYSLANITELLADCKLAVAFDQTVRIQEKIMPTLLIPSFKIDAKYHPAKFHILEVTKI